MSLITLWYQAVTPDDSCCSMLYAGQKGHREHEGQGARETGHEGQGARGAGGMRGREHERQGA